MQLFSQKSKEKGKRFPKQNLRRGGGNRCASKLTRQTAPACRVRRWIIGDLVLQREPCGIARKQIKHPAGRPRRASAAQASYHLISPSAKPHSFRCAASFPLQSRCWIAAGTLRNCPQADQASSRQATPGRSLPSMNSREAPPPVEMWVILSA